MRDPSDITPLQTRILEVLWRDGSATAEEIRSALRGKGEIARTTVATVLGRMEKSGWLMRARVGRHYAYAPALTRAQVRRSQTRQLIGSLFSNDLPSLVSHALHEGDWDEGDLDRIEALVQEYRARSASEGSA